MRCALSIVVGFWAIAGSAANWSMPSYYLPAADYWGRTNVGVPGGIDSYSAARTQWCNVKVLIPGTNIVAIGDGATDDGPALQAALTLCPSNGIVYLPTATYRTSNTLTLKTGITMRGDGMSNSTINSYASGSAIGFSGGGVSRWVQVTNGLYQGSKVIEVDGSDGDWSATYYKVGTVLCISTANDTNILEGIDGSDPDDLLGQYNLITNITGVSIGLDHPIYWPWTNFITTNIVTIARSGTPGVGIGLENFTVNRLFTGGDHNIVIGGGIYCWIKGVRSYNPDLSHFKFSQSYRCEIRECVADYGQLADGNSDYGAHLTLRCTDCLVEDSIFVNCRHSLIVEYGGMGNVFGYNYSKDPINEGQLSTTFLMLDSVSHGGTPMYNLWEGNVVAKMGWDNENGGARYNTLYRCWAQRKGLPTVSSGIRACEVQMNCISNCVVANILCFPGESADAYIWTNNVPSASVWRFGNDGSTYKDPRSWPSTYMHFNWDFIYSSNQVTVGESTNGFPASLYLTSKPDWFGNCAWPSFGMDLGQMTNLIPAQARYLGIDYAVHARSARAVRAKVGNWRSP